MKNPDDYSDEEIRDMVRRYYQDNKRKVTNGQIPFYMEKLSNLSEYVKEIKQRFARYYNKQHRRSGYFWGDRFKSVIVEDGDTLINCLAYIDLNPVSEKIDIFPIYLSYAAYLKLTRAATKFHVLP